MTTTRAFRPASRTGSTLTAILDFAAASHRRAAAVLVVFCALAFLPGFFQIPPIDRDEARFAQATKQMVERGDYVDIRFQDEVRYKKPVGIYWLQAAVIKTADALGVRNAHTRIALYRVPSLAGAIGGVLVTYWAALAFVSRRGAVLAALMMAASVLLGVEARLAKTDAVLLLCVTAAMGAMAHAYMRAGRDDPPAARGWLLPAVFWTALAAGVLVKGPLIFMFVLLAAAGVLAFDRRAGWLKDLRPLPGLAWFLLLVLPWFAAIVWKSGASFFVNAVGHDMLGKVTSGQESHGALPGYYFLLFWATFWPGAVLAGLAAPAVWQARRERGARFLIAWLVPSWIVFELVATKLPHYVLPLYPAVAIMIAGAIEQGVLSRRALLRHGTMWWLLFPLVVLTLAVAATMVFGRHLGLLAWPFAAGAAILGMLAWRLYDADGPELSLLRGAAAGLMMAIAIYGVVFPSLPRLFPSDTLARLLRHAPCKPSVAAAGFHEPSLVFLAGTDTLMTDGAGAADFLRQGACRYAFVDSRSQNAFVKRAEAIGLRYSAGPRVEGVNLGRTRVVTIAVFYSEARP